MVIVMGQELRLTFKRLTGVSTSFSFLIFRSWRYDEKVGSWLMSRLCTPNLPEAGEESIHSAWFYVNQTPLEGLKAACSGTHSTRDHRAACSYRNGYTAVCWDLSERQLRWGQRFEQLIERCPGTHAVDAQTSSTAVPHLSTRRQIRQNWRQAPHPDLRVHYLPVTIEMTNPFHTPCYPI